MDRPDEPKQRVPGPRSHAERRFSGTAARPRAHAAAARLAPVARHAGGTRPARPRTRGGDRQPAAVTYEAIADRKIGHAALRPEICSGIVARPPPCRPAAFVIKERIIPAAPKSCGTCSRKLWRKAQRRQKMTTPPSPEIIARVRAEARGL